MGLAAPETPSGDVGGLDSRDRGPAALQRASQKAPRPTGRGKRVATRKLNQKGVPAHVGGALGRRGRVRDEFARGLIGRIRQQGQLPHQLQYGWGQGHVGRLQQEVGGRELQVLGRADDFLVVTAAAGRLAGVLAAAVLVRVGRDRYRRQGLPTEVHAVDQPGAGQQVAKEQKQADVAFHRQSRPGRSQCISKGTGRVRGEFYRIRSRTYTISKLGP